MRSTRILEKSNIWYQYPDPSKLYPLLTKLFSKQMVKFLILTVRGKPVNKRNFISPDKIKKSDD